MARLLRVRDLSCARDKDHKIFSNLNFDVNEGDVVVLQGKSGVGKTSLLKCVAHLNIYSGEVLYKGRAPKSYGVPTYRTKVSYVPQRPSLLAGTPRDFLNTVSSFSSRTPKTTVRRSNSDLTYPIEVANAWGIDEELWDRSWSNLSGGESQRIALAIAVGLDTAEILLLDEPTSALDPHSTTLVERFISDELKSAESGLKAAIWITHSEEQGRRVGTRFLHITPTGCEEEPTLFEP
ncbi:P-loop containing nucleoside triphosphate hydrolase protein [Pisolithus orientalis]|uniref:P-loop containing nucleoside triphosphate hydrolase protein n=1 Tax=Pisolithus orientalis TaxID=936130 RepID=UPI0022259BD2|nr:P-loop containing nucleoside triphosphate hydrolase protein [Pisolithus orientalis]KAI6028425.1 P-loop containing nucleoside triphosphate hydrolase protein [Pisolithus orientalis]